jgi:hypothetical protein
MLAFRPRPDLPTIIVGIYPPAWVKGKGYMVRSVVETSQVSMGRIRPLTGRKTAYGRIGTGRSGLSLQNVNSRGLGDEG